MGGSGSMEMAALNSIHDILYAAVFHIIDMATHIAKANTSHIACIERSIHGVLHATVFHIIGMAKLGKGKHFSHGLHAYSMGWGP